MIFQRAELMNTEATLKGNVLHDIAHWGISASIGVIFIVHSIKKFDPSWQEWLISNWNSTRAPITNCSS